MKHGLTFHAPVPFHAGPLVSFYPALLCPAPELGHAVCSSPPSPARPT